MADYSTNNAYGGYSSNGNGQEQGGNHQTGKLINSTEVGNEGKMFVGGLSKQTTTESLKAYFEGFGVVKDVSVKMDPMTNQSRGFGFVLFEDESSIDSVVAVPHHNLDGKKIDPKKAERRDGKMFVGGVKADTADETLRNYFSQFGEVETVDRPVDKSTGVNKSFCFITFKRDGIMKHAVKARYHEIDGKRCECKEGVPKSQMQGGGQGGGWGGQGGYGGQQGGYGGHQGGYGGQQGGYGGYGGQQGGYGGQQGGYGGGWGNQGGAGQYGGQGGGQGYGNWDGYNNAPRGGGRGGGRSRGGGRGGAKFAPY